MREHKLSIPVLARALDAVYRCASDDEDRPQINSILIELGPDLKTTATNGHAVAHYSTPLAPDIAPIVRYQVMRQDVLPAIEALRRSTTGYIDWCDDCGNRIDGKPLEKDCLFMPLDEQIGLFDEDTLIAAMRTVKEDFPPFEKVIPPRTGASFDDGFFCIQTEYIRLIADCVEAAFPKPTAICMEPIGKLEPTVWSYQDDASALVIVCMPMRDKDAFVRPYSEASK